MTDVETIVRWRGASGHDHRIQTYQLPGSAHWAVVKDSRGPGGVWTRDWGTESSEKPTFADALDEMPSDSVAAHERHPANPRR